MITTIDGPYLGVLLCDPHTITVEIVQDLSLIDNQKNQATLADALSQR